MLVTPVLIAGLLWGAGPVSATPASGGLAAGVADEAAEPSIEMVIKDYTVGGKLVDTHRVTMPVSVEALMEPSSSDEPAPGEFTILAAGNYTMPAPTGSTGCRSAYDVAQYDGYYRLKHSVSWCWSKVTGKVTSPSASQSVLDASLYTDVSVYSHNKSYYNWNSIANSGYYSKLQWHATWTPAGVPVHFYPRIDIYMHGNGSAYFSWNGDAAG
ncbi:hypothetical protein GCM10017772_34540 [Promicromonospora soli]|uniref:Uncharacterized protein n=1 Tax=Promicromonospora soli TaxID=2035533 RepID=A0A919KWP3_9MICO|nr:hypothetical protein GCM10017772_34540 [Promicromonospora soli]